MTKKPCYMMATKASHQMGDISSDDPDLAQIFRQDKENYIGNWVFGFGFINVKFPKATTRPLTESEKDHFAKGGLEMGGRILYKFKRDDFDGNENTKPRDSEAHK